MSEEMHAVFQSKFDHHLPDFPLQRSLTGLLRVPSLSLHLP
jgi:hypothetical protein